MKAIITILFITVILLSGCKHECNTNIDCLPDDPLVGVQYICEQNKCISKPFGNPASTYCIEQGGTIEMRTDDTGQYGVCIFDNSECEEWAFFRGECDKEDKANYSLSQIAQHNSASDCWLAINSKVYNVTEFINSHPGGSAILQGCGTNASNLYESRPMGSKTPHSPKARSLLEEYEIGVLTS
jgi:putative hemolysin